MAYVKAKCGLRIRDYKPSETGAREHSDPMNVHLAREMKKGSSNPRDGCFKCSVAHFQRDCIVHVTRRKGNGKNGKQNKSLSMSAGTGKSKEMRETAIPREKPKVPKVPKARIRERLRKMVYLALKKPKSERCQETHCTDVSQ